MRGSRVLHNRLDGRVRQRAIGRDHVAGTLDALMIRAVSPEQAEITRLRAELSRAKMEVSILKKATVYFAKESQ